MSLEPELLCALLLAAACGRGTRQTAATRRLNEAAHDSAFAAVQSRGEQVMGVDQYTSTHIFEPLADGGRIALERDGPDSAGAVQIRRHLKQVAAAFEAADFSQPGVVHAQKVPGTDVMAAKRAAIRYTVESLPLGAALRLRTEDSAAVRAIHDFLAFQRQEHHATTQ
jgi:hypothetical protein